MRAFASLDCPSCGQVDISEVEYNRQLDRPGERWECSKCHNAAEFNDKRSEQLMDDYGDTEDNADDDDAEGAEA